MISFLNLLGIYEADIQSAYSSIEDEYENIGLDSLFDASDLAKRTVDYLRDEKVTENMGNIIISKMLDAAESILIEKVAPYKPEINKYCNGSNSSFSVSEDDAEIIRIATEYCIDYDFTEWLYNTISDPDDFKYVVGNSELREALENLRENDGELVWSDFNETGLTDKEAEEKEQICIQNPQDIENIFIWGPSNKIWTIFSE